MALPTQPVVESNFLSQVRGSRNERNMPISKAITGEPKKPITW